MSIPGAAPWPTANNDAAIGDACPPNWQACRYLTCSVLPVRMACNCLCPFCFSKSSVSSLRHDTIDWTKVDLDGYFRFAKSRGASRLVVTGGGEPLLRGEAVLDVIHRGKQFFDEITCFTNGSLLTRQLARKLADTGLSYLCFSRHHFDERFNRRLMGEAAPTLANFFEAAECLRVLATCVMARGFIDSERQVWQYIDRLSRFGVWQFTFKHTYVAYERSVFTHSSEDRWAAEHRISFDPFAGHG
jgi:MoaA/NifB/PqqE/SkfB family radical SAM enzyme